MGNNAKSKRFFYPTQGVCPPEIHFDVRDGILDDIRFVGGGCPGNAQLVSRLLVGKSLDEVLDVIKGIDCRNGTSCPDQLSRAIRAANSGTLQPVKSFRLAADEFSRQCIGLIGAPNGNSASLEKISDALGEQGAEAIYCLGNLCAEQDDNKTLLRMITQKGIPAVQGERDWQYAEGTPSASLPHMDQRQRDRLLQLPQVLKFELADKQGVAFYGEYVQHLPGFSDFEPFALEINMVCGLTDFMQNDSVFPALEAMTPQFQADIIVFGQSGRWGHWHVGEKDFIGLGPAVSPRGFAGGLLEIESGTVRFRTLTVP